MGRDKRPAIAKNPGEREVRATEMPDWNQFQICWHFRQMDLAIECPFGWYVCDRVTLVDKIMERIKSYETMRWRDIDKKLLHPIAVSKLNEFAKKRLVEIEQDDVEELWALRIEKEPRIWGIRDRLYFKVLWWDPNHKVYPVNVADN